MTDQDDERCPPEQPRKQTYDEKREDGWARWHKSTAPMLREVYISGYDQGFADGVTRYEHP